MVMATTREEKLPLMGTGWCDEPLLAFAERLSELIPAHEVTPQRFCLDDDGDGDDPDA
jgi:hypothetical protein